MTDDTLTLNDGEMSQGMGYTIKRNTFEKLFALLEPFKCHWNRIKKVGSVSGIGCAPDQVPWDQ